MNGETEIGNNETAPESVQRRRYTNAELMELDSYNLRKRDWLMLIVLLPVFLVWSLYSPLTGWQRVLVIIGSAVLIGCGFGAAVWLFR